MSDHDKLIKEYREKYDTKGRRFIYKGKRAKIDTITAEDLQTTAMTTKETAAGLDQWAPADVKMLSTKAFKYLADMLNDIEGGAPWPEQLNIARAAFLSKGSEDELNPLAYRVLLMLPAVYRMWSKTRLRHLQAWIAEWTPPEMYAWG